jgi:DNA-binding MarR family transcriptional regulator
VNISFDDLHKAFESRIRLGIMSVLAVNDSLDFNALKEFLDATDGNLATHIKKLDQLGFVDSQKSFVDNKPNTKYQITKEGKMAFEDHLKVLETIINSQK